MTATSRRWGRLTVATQGTDRLTRGRLTGRSREIGAIPVVSAGVYIYVQGRLTRRSPVPPSGAG